MMTLPFPHLGLPQSWCLPLKLREIIHRLQSCLDIIREKDPLTLNVPFHELIGVTTTFKPSKCDLDSVKAPVLIISLPKPISYISNPIVSISHPILISLALVPPQVPRSYSFPLYLISISSRIIMIIKLLIYLIIERFFVLVVLVGYLWCILWMWCSGFMKRCFWIFLKWSFVLDLADHKRNILFWWVIGCGFGCGVGCLRWFGGFGFWKVGVLVVSGMALLEENIDY